VEVTTPGLTSLCFYVLEKHAFGTLSSGPEVRHFWHFYYTPASHRFFPLGHLMAQHGRGQELVLSQHCAWGLDSHVFSCSTFSLPFAIIWWNSVLTCLCLIDLVSSFAWPASWRHSCSINRVSYVCVRDVPDLTVPSKWSAGGRACLVSRVGWLERGRASGDPKLCGSEKS
jgi:hypothetical protein